jgi:2-isopropylmalate synthase
MTKIEIYDTILRDGSQGVGISFSLEDKLRIAAKLDELGVVYIEGGFPLSNAVDREFFQQAKKLNLRRAQLVAFGMTRKAGSIVGEDQSIKALIESGAPVVTIFGKTWDLHVREALGISLEENLEIIRDSISYLKKQEHIKKVFFDAEHFFDGHKANPEYALQCLQVAVEAGVDCLALCDTNGGCLPLEVREIILEVKEKISTPLGIHAHNDGGCAVANSLMAAVAGVSQIQGTMNGLGERCGNADLCLVIPNLILKMKLDCGISASQLKMLREVSKFIDEIANREHSKNQPFVGDNAFAHKAGIHASANAKLPGAYEHIDPALVGNDSKTVASELSGVGVIEEKARNFGITIHKEEALEILQEVKTLGEQGYQFEAAEASLELLIRKKCGLYNPFFNLIGSRVLVEKRYENETLINEATIKIKLPSGEVRHVVADGNGPVDALNNALRKALQNYYPELNQVALLDYKVRVLTSGQGTAAKIRVLIESGSGEKRWGTVGVSENVIEASWQALVDSLEYFLLKK